MSDPKDENETPDHCAMLPYVEQRLKDEEAEYKQLVKELQEVLGGMLQEAVPTKKPSE
jgi:uncharacterized protein YqcC (DUF446 family)